MSCLIVYRKFFVLTVTAGKLQVSRLFLAQLHLEKRGSTLALAASNEPSGFGVRLSAPICDRSVVDKG